MPPFVGGGLAIIFDAAKIGALGGAGVARLGILGLEHKPTPESV